MTSVAVRGADRTILSSGSRIQGGLWPRVIRTPRRPVARGTGAHTRRMSSARRSDFDVTDTVQVSSPAAVLAAVEALFAPTWPSTSLEPLRRAFEHFERLFAGDVPGFHGVDTVYHDRQHTLDITLALARLLVGFERQAEPAARLGGERAVAGLITGLFHDVSTPSCRAAAAATRWPRSLHSAGAHRRCMRC